MSIHNAKWIVGAMQPFQEDLFEWIESHQTIQRQAYAPVLAFLGLALFCNTTNDPVHGFGVEFSMINATHNGLLQLT